MTDQRKSHPKPAPNKGGLGASRAKRRGEEFAPAATAFREEFQPDFGPDPDEPLDVTESGREF
jgi:hypothetical protein